MVFYHSSHLNNFFHSFGQNNTDEEFYSMEKKHGKVRFVLQNWKGFNYKTIPFIGFFQLCDGLQCQRERTLFHKCLSLPIIPIKTAHEMTYIETLTLRPTCLLDRWSIQDVDGEENRSAMRKPPTLVSELSNFLIRFCPEWNCSLGDKIWFDQWACTL